MARELYDPSRPELPGDNFPVIFDDVKGVIEAVLDVREWRVNKSIDRLIITVGKNARSGGKAGHNSKTGRRRRDSEDVKLRAIALETKHRFPDVAGVKMGVAHAALCHLIERNCVVQQDDRNAGRNISQD